MREWQVKRREAVLGINADSQIDYGQSADGLAAKLQSMVQQFGERAAAKALRIPAARLRKLAAGEQTASDNRLARMIAPRLSAAISLCEKADYERHAELHRLRAAVKRDGLRQTARRLGVDPSNLRRRLQRSSPAAATAPV